MRISEEPLAYLKTEILRKQLYNFSRIYLLIGLLEKSLQTVIPTLFSNYSQLHGLAHWYDVPPLSGKGEISLRMAIRKAEELGFDQTTSPLESFLPLSFWRYLVRQNNYGKLWVPILFEAFPNLRDPKRMPAFNELDRRLGFAVKVRNQIAHYEFRDGQDLNIPIRNLLWLLAAMDKELRIIGEELIADTSRRDPIQ